MRLDMFGRSKFQIYINDFILLHRFTLLVSFGYPGNWRSATVVRHIDGSVTAWGNFECGGNTVCRLPAEVSPVAFCTCQRDTPKAHSCGRLCLRPEICRKFLKNVVMDLEFQLPFLQ